MTADLQTSQDATARPPGKARGGRQLAALDTPRLEETTPNLRRVLVGTDALAAATGWTLVLVWFGTPVAASSLLAALGVRAFAVLGLTLLTLSVLAAAKLYRARVCALRSVEARGLTRGVLLVGGLLLVAREVLHVDWGLPAIAAGTAVSFVLLVVGRAAFRGRMAQLRRRGEAVWPVLIVGANSEAGQLHRLIEEHPEQSLQVRGIVGDEAEAAEHVAGAQWLTDLDGLDWAVRASGVNGVIVATTALPPAQLNETVRRLVDAGLHVQLSSGLQGIGAHRLQKSPVAHEPLFYLEPVVLSPWQKTAKRTLDIALASIVLALALPVMVATAIGIKLQDRGPVLFSQQRVGQGGRHFTLLKFRSMVVDAEERLVELEAHNQRSGPLFKVAGDPRVTSFGRFLRTTSIDELPQLINVLRGEMSLVGPRPALPSEVAEFSDRLKQRNRVRPGITGLWQVEARDKPSFWSYERLDLFYVENWSVGLDLSIIGGTAVAVIRRGLAAVRDIMPRRQPTEQPLHVLD